MQCGKILVNLSFRDKFVYMLKTKTIAAQANTYKILSRLFDFPEESFHGEHTTYEDLISQAERLESKFLELSKKLSLSAKEQKLEAHYQEYLRLFAAVPQAGPMVSLQARAYLPLPDDVIDQLIRFYQHVEFTPGFSNHPPDHLCNELDFVRHINERLIGLINSEELDAAKKLNKFKCIFMQDHFLKWLPELTRKILFSTSSPYYLQLSIIARTVLVNCINRDNAEN